MSIETTCDKCGAEYDMRHGSCPACNPTISVEMRSAHPPYKMWAEPGYLPFEMHGERFAVTRIPCALDSPIKWRVSHVSTGVAVPNSAAETHEEAKSAGMESLAAVGPEKFKKALSRVREIIAFGA